MASNRAHTSHDRVTIHSFSCKSVQARVITKVMMPENMAGASLINTRHLIHLSTRKCARETGCTPNEDAISRHPLGSTTHPLPYKEFWRSYSYYKTKSAHILVRKPAFLLSIRKSEDLKTRKVCSAQKSQLWRKQLKNCLPLIICPLHA